MSQVEPKAVSVPEEIKEISWLRAIISMIIIYPAAALIFVGIYFFYSLITKPIFIGRFGDPCVLAHGFSMYLYSSWFVAFGLVVLFFVLESFRYKRLSLKFRMAVGVAIFAGISLTGAGIYGSTVERSEWSYDIYKGSAEEYAACRANIEPERSHILW